MIIEYLKNIIYPDIRKYKKWRRIGMGLNSKIMKEIPVPVMKEAAGDLGQLAKEGTFIFDSESDTSYVADRAFYDIRENGKNSIDNFIDKYGHTLSSDEKKLVYAMQSARYSLFSVEKIKYGQGAYLKDVFSGKSLFLMDINMSETCLPSYIVSTRIISIDTICFTSGTSCVFSYQCLGGLKANFEYLKQIKSATMTWQQIMEKYNPFFVKEMKKYKTVVEFSKV